MASKSKDRVLTISINNEFIKICDLTRSGKGVIVHKALTIPVPANSYNDGTIKDREYLAKAIKIELDKNRITTDDVLFTITSSRIASKEVVIPKVKPNKIAEIINTNATEYFPVNINEYIIRYTTLEEFKDGGADKLKLLVLAVPSKMVSGYYSLASSIGLKVLGVDFVGNSVSEVVKRNVDNTASVIVYVENDSTIVNVFQNGLLKLQRTIPYGESVIVKECMAEYKLDYVNAVNKLSHENLIGSHIDDNKLTEQLRYLISNVRRIIDYYVSKNENSTIENAYILGTVSFMRGFDRLFSTELNIPFVAVTQLKDVVADKKTYVDASTVPSYVPNIGAAYATINFKPNNVAEQKSSKASGKGVKILFIISVIAAAALTIIPSFKVYNTKLKIREVNAKIDRVKGIEQVVNDYYQAKDVYTDAENFRNLTINNDDKLAEFITALEQTIPSDISFTSISIDNGAYTISGTAGGKTSVAALIQQLRGMEHVSNVIVANESEAKDNSGAITATFALTFNYTLGQ